MLRSTLTALLVLACATLGTAACQSDTLTATEPEAPSPMTSTEPAPRSPQARQAVRDLAGRLGISEDDVSVVSVEEVTWRDGSLGCAEPGTMYSQALVDGSRITLDAGGEPHEYHAGGSRDPFPCDDPTQ